MKTLNFAFWRALAALIIGVLLVMYPNEIGNYFIIIIGIVFLVPSIISLISHFFVNNKEEISRRFPIEAIGSLLFGLWLMITPGFFADLLTYLLGFILIMGGVQQIASLLAARKWSEVPGGFFVMPVLILLAGLFALFNPGGIRSTAFIIIGVAAIVYAMTDLLNWFRFMRHRPKEVDVVVQDAVVIEEVQETTPETTPEA
ncbi:MAG: DUF308 domain-containing protein [Mediterranea massiliensis]|nr:DUF308 domain-containing protein [Mediterranea massiliensis]